MTATLQRKIVTLIAAMLLVSLPVVGFSQSDAAAIKYRRSLMKGQTGHLGAMFGIVKGGVGRATDLAVHARALQELTGMLVPAFEQDTMGGETRAKSEIWDDFNAFKSKAADAEKAATGIVRAVESGNRAVLGKALGGMGKACKGCHKKYREKQK